MSPTASVAEMLCHSDFTVESVGRNRAGSHRATGTDIAASATAMVGRLSEYPVGAGMLISVQDPIRALEVAVAGWHAGLRVAFARVDSPLSLDQQARVVGAAVHVSDPAPRPAAPAHPETRGLSTVAYPDLIGDPVRRPSQADTTDIALDVLSSGSTGVPSCVVYTHAAIIANATALADAMGVVADDRLWTSVHHGLPGTLCTVILPAAARGATAMLQRPGIAGVTAALSEAAPTIVYAVPELYEALARRAPSTSGQRPEARWWLSSSCTLSPFVFERMYGCWKAVVRSFYCGSEIGTVTFNDCTDIDQVRAGVGRVLTGVKVAVDAASGRLTVRGGLIGYGYRTPDGVAPFPADGVHTTDLGGFDEDGLLYLRGRVDDRIHVGAQVIDPHVVEARIATLPAVAECLVVASPHPRLGHVLEARVRPRPGEPITDADVIRHCHRQGLTGGWVPRSVTWMTSMPRTPAGKPRRDPLGAEPPCRRRR